MYTGGAGLTYEGGKSFVIDLAMTSTGKVEVTKNTLSFAENGSWKKTSHVAVSGTGKIVIDRKGIFGGRAAFSVDYDGVISLGEGLVQRCASLAVNSVTVPPGRYGGENCAFNAVDKTYAKYFAGNGVLTVGECSLAIIVR